MTGLQLSDQLAAFMETRFKHKLHLMTKVTGEPPVVKYPTSIATDLLGECIQIVDVLVTAFMNPSKFADFTGTSPGT